PSFVTVNVSVYVPPMKALGGVVGGVHGVSMVHVFVILRCGLMQIGITHAGVGPAETGSCVQMSVPVAVAVSETSGQSANTVVIVLLFVQTAPGARSPHAISEAPCLLLTSWITTLLSGTSPSFVTVKVSV